MERWDSEYWESLRGTRAYWLVTLVRLPGGGVLDWTCGWWHGIQAANDADGANVSEEPLGQPHP